MSRSRRIGLFSISLLLILVLFSQVTQQFASAAEENIELAYDDGTSDTNWQWNNNALAVRFSPPAGQWMIVAVKYYVDSNPTGFSALILDSDRKVLLEKPATPTATGWLTIDVSSEKILVKGDFYAAMKCTVANGTYLGTDTTRPDGRSFWVGLKAGQWTAYKDDPVSKGKDADFMIRVMLAPAVFLNLKDVKSQPSAAAGEPLYVGDVGTVTYVLENNGVVAAKKVEVRVAQADPEVEIVNVAAPKDLKAGATDEWQVKLKASKPGTYEVRVSFYIDGEKVTFKVEGQEETVDEFKITINASERPFLQTFGVLLQTYGLYIAGGVAAIIVVAVVAILATKRKGKERRAAAPPITIPPAAPVTTVFTPTVPAAPAPTPQTGDKFCINCGSPMPATSKFCPKCGSEQS